MPVYVVERYLPGITSEQLGAAAARAKSTTAQMSKEGTPVRYLRSTFIPSEEKCACLFEGPSVEAVEQANERAQIPFERVVEAKHIASEDLG
ncbi:MAG TPA: DUF4242 domain-containing protein [Chloroflexota bacterium]|nr:DUF4242 domain-containing protein [Chloroflexota bacterium]